MISLLSIEIVKNEVRDYLLKLVDYLIWLDVEREEKNIQENKKNRED